MLKLPSLHTSDSVELSRKPVTQPGAHEAPDGTLSQLDVLKPNVAEQEEPDVAISGL